MQNNHQHAAPTQHNKQSGRPRYDMQSQQQQYNPRFNRPQGGGNMPRQPHPGLSQAGQQQQQSSQVIQVPAHPQQIPQQQTRVQQPQLTPPQPQYGVYPAPSGIQVVSYATQPNQMSQTMPQQFRLYNPATPAYVQTTPAFGFNHIQQWQLAQNTQQQLQNHAAQQQYYQQLHQHQGVQHMQQILPGQQYYAVRAQPTFVQGPSLQSTSAPPQQLPVQTQPTHQAHHVQHQQTQSNPNVGIMQVSQVQQQPEQRENVPPPSQRKKKVLPIVDPNTGNSIFEGMSDAPPASPAAELEPSPSAEASTEEPAVVSLNSASTPNAVSTPQTSPNPSYAEETAKPIEEKEKVRSEFFQKITKLGDDRDETNAPAGRGDGQTNAQPASTTASSTTTELSTPPSPTPPPPSTEPESAIKVESANATAIAEAECTQDAEKVDTKEQTPITVSLNGTSGSIQEASLCSISPTPIEKYVGSNSPEVTTVSADVSSVSSPLTEGLENREIAHTPEIPERQESPASEAYSPDTDERDNIPVVSYNSTVEPEAEEELTEKIQRLTVSDEAGTTEAETLQNGKSDIADDDHHGEDDEPPEEGEINEAEDTTTQSSGVKRRIMYDRDQLLAFKQNKDTHLDMQIPPDLVKDPNRPNSAQVGNFNFKGSPVGPPHLGRPGMSSIRRGGPMQDMQQNRQINWSGRTSSGGPFAVPPPFHSPKAPKVMELHREKVELHKAENAWKPSVVEKKKGKNNEEVDKEQLALDDVVKKTRSILNKLTPENFDKLVSKFLQLPLEDKDERIQKVIHVVFEKAVDEPSFSTAYANMVRTVCDKSQETAKKFRKQILDQCQREFQKGSTDEEEIKKLEEELSTAEDSKKDAIKLDIEDKRYQTRRRALGNVRFIGELYKLQMLTPKIMIECVTMLLGTQDEESLECLCKLLTTVGQRLEQQLLDTELRARELQSKGQAPKWTPDSKFMDKTFANLKTLSSSNKLSSRIRFALMDVHDLRENGWKPRRDAAGPKKIDEVRRDAVRQEQEEKRQLQNLPPAQPMSRQGQPPQQKKGDWNTVQSNKSSRFAAAMKKPGEQPGPTSLLLGPPGGAWNRGPSSQGPPKPQNLPPRLMHVNSNNKFSALSPEERTPFRHEIVQQPPPPIRTPPVIGNTSRESSRPQTPSRDQPPPPAEEDDEHLNDKEREIVKNIFNEFMNNRKADDSLDWIQDRFKGRKVYSFIEEISRLVSEMYKEDQQKTAGSLLNILIRKGIVSKHEVIKTLKGGVISDLCDITVDVPKVTSYMAVFLVELFFDESDLLWLLEFDSVFDQENEEAWDVWKSLVSDTLNIHKLRRNEEAVQHLFKQTKGANRFPIEDIPWVAGETVDSLSKKMIKVLEEEYPKQKDFNICSEQFDLRNELTSKSLIQALCVVCWKEKEQEWNIPYFEEVLVKSRLPIVRDHLPFLWKQAMEFITSKKIDKANEEKLWSLMNRLNLVDPSHEREPA